MTLTLRPVPQDRMPAWIRRSADEYARDLVTTGRSKDEARRVADDGMAASFPDGSPRPGHAVLDLLDDLGHRVGYLWLGPSGQGEAGQWWVWDVLVDEAHRRKGYGGAAMRLAEQYAAAHGATSLGLSVFGFNAGARALYESLGYETTSVKMAKRLQPPA